MKYYIGIDGGGTKTEFLLADENHKILSRTLRGSASYMQIGEGGLIDLLDEGIENLIRPLQIAKDDEFHTCFGMPLYGEHRNKDEVILKSLKERLGKYRIKTVNDVEAGWAGSLEMESGINIVAGTGSIAFGKNPNGESAKAGGWSEFFSDEGSCYWLGRKAMECFSKEADGRFRKGALYEIMKEKFQLDHDYDLIGILEADYIPYRDRVASLQVCLKDAAMEGDMEAVRLYEHAAYELMLIVRSVHEKLKMGKGCKVSYSGGLFKTEDLILRPFERYLKPLDITLVPPKKTPAEGALLLAKYYENR